MCTDDSNKQADTNEPTKAPAAAEAETEGDGATQAAAPTEGDGAAQAAAPTEGDAETAAPDAPAEPSLEEQLAESKAATGRMKEKMLRVAADFENFRRRASREVEEARQRGSQNTIKELLPVFDNLERATAHVDDKTDVQSMTKGLEMVHKQFLDVLGKMGIERVASVGEGFDPNVHESIQYEHSAEHEAGVVMTELQPGYRMGTMLLRPALVVVSRGPAPEPAEEPADEEPEAGGEAAMSGDGSRGAETTATEEAAGEASEAADGASAAPAGGEAKD